MLLFCWASLTMTSVDRSTWGPASLQAGAALGVSLAGLAAFATAYYVGYVLSNIGGGLLGDRLGSRVVLSGPLFGGLWGTYGFVTWSNTLMVTGHGIDAVAAGTVVVVFAAAGAVGKPVIGLATDLAGRGRKRPAVAVLVVFAGCLLVFGGMESETAFLVMAAFAGLGAYLYAPLLVAMVPGLSGMALAGSAAGAMNAVAQLGSVTVPVVVGAVYQATGSFPAAFATLAVGPLAGAAALSFVREAGPSARRRSPQSAGA